MKGRFSLVFTLALIVGDIIAILGAYSLAYIIRVKVSNMPIETEFLSAKTYFLCLALLLPFNIILFSLIGLYKTPRSILGLIGKLLMGIFGAMLFMIFIDYFNDKPIFPTKLVPLYGLAISAVLISLERGALYLARYFRHRRRIGMPTVLVVGDNSVAQAIVCSINQPSSGYHLQGVVGDRRYKWVNYKNFHDAVNNFKPNIVIQTATTEKPKINRELLEFCKKNYIEFKFVPSDINDLAERLEFSLFGDIPVINVQPTRLVGWGRLFKRLFDLIASLALIIVLLPIFTVIYLVEKLTNPSDTALFRQTRLTRGNKKFQLYKFRTQYAKYDGTTPEQAFELMGQPNLIKLYRKNGDFLEDDPRITKLGEFLRRTSLDELPQLFNVLKGDISLVGPRALIPEELNQFNDKHVILNVKSGITGLAQISGRRDLDFESRRKLDVYYVQNWRFSLDIQILFSTFWQVLTGRGAK